MTESISDCITMLMQLSSTAFLCFYAMRDSLRLSLRRITLYTALFCLIFPVLAMPLYVQGFWSVFVIIAAVVAALLFVFYAVSASRGKLLFMLLFAVSFSYLSNALWGTLFMLIRLYHPLEFDYLDVALCAVSILLLLPAYLWITRKLWNNVKGLPEGLFWLRMSAILLMFICLYYTSTAMYYEDIIPIFFCEVLDLIITACALVTYPQMLSALRRTAESARYAERLVQTDNQLKLQRERMEDLTAHMAEVKQMRHDMRHHLTALKQLLDQAACGKPANTWRRTPPESRTPQRRRYAQTIRRTPCAAAIWPWLSRQMCIPMCR